MVSEAGTWALILAAGEGTRLRSLTTAPSGFTIPKQYCSLHEGPSLLHEALFRAGAVAAAAHTCAVVAEHHRRWWASALSYLPGSNVVVQPANRGTANGILLPLLHILERDPDARVLLLPADHHVRSEAVLAASLRRATEQLEWRLDEMLLLGLRPEQADPELGYIVPALSDGRGALHVSRFIEKPPAAQARALIGRGALWNAFILATSARALLGLFRRRMPEIVAAMRAAVQSDLRAGTMGIATSELYAHLPTLDFSRDILPGEEPNLRVLPVPQCGWSDLGTPQRVAEVLRGMPAPRIAPPAEAVLGHWSLAAQHARQSATAD